MASPTDADWVDVSIPTREVKRLRLDTELISTTALHETIQNNAETLLNDHPKSPLFRVDYDHASGSLSTVYEQSYPTSLRQEFICVTCRNFMRRFGDLALVDEHTGAILPLFWNPAGHIDPFLGPVSAVAKLFEGRKVIKEFKVTKSTQHAGIPECGGWNHMSFSFCLTRVTPPVLPGLSVASTPDLVTMLTQVLKDYDLDTVVGRLEGDQGTLKAVDAVPRHNILFHTAASSFLGCLKQLRSGAVVTVLSDVKDNKSFEDIQESWNNLTDPLHCMRPTAAPSAGNIAVAERLFESLGLTQEDMRRAYLTTASIPEAVYMFRDHQHKPLPMSKEGIFGHIVPKNATKKQAEPNGTDEASNSDPPTTMSFSTFAKKIVPNAKRVEYKLPSETSLYFFITGLPGTKRLMQWHDTTNRVSWYTHTGPMYVKNFGLGAGWTAVPYIIPFPHLWDAPAATTFPLSEDPAAFKYYHSKQGFRYLIGLDGIKEASSSELCLFPALLRSEFHGVRSTIERYSKMGQIETTEGWVGGVAIDKSKHDVTHLFRVTLKNGQQGTYEIMLFE